MSEVVIYLGPSLAIEVAKSTLPIAEYRPPIRRGDLLYDLSAFRLVGIIDGEFTPMISPKEVLQALVRGATVLGASGLGALRAAELHLYGVVGIGTIFQWFNSGYLQNDDAVAVAYNPQTFQRLSEPLVNIVYALSRATEDGVIQSEEKDELISVSRNTYYPDRTYSHLFANAVGRISADKLTALQHYISRHDFDLQQRDAILLLKSIPYYLAHPPDLSKSIAIHGMDFRRFRRLPGLHE